MILGDNLFHGTDLVHQLKQSDQAENFATIFAYPVSDPERYGVAEFDNEGNVIGLEEKPAAPKSRYAVTGLYFFDESVCDKAKKVTPSPRGEFEITDINKMYLSEGLLRVERMGRGMAWLDTGTYDSLNAASSYIQTLENRQGLKVGCQKKFPGAKDGSTSEQLLKNAEKIKKCGYGNYLANLLEKNN